MSGVKTKATKVEDSGGIDDALPAYEDLPVMPDLAHYMEQYAFEFPVQNEAPPPYTLRESPVTIVKPTKTSESVRKAVGTCGLCSTTVYSSPGEPYYVTKKGTVYHEACYLEKISPKCAYCFSPLAPTLNNNTHDDVKGKIDAKDEKKGEYGDEKRRECDADMSGAWILYKGEPYHYECYKKYAGPRCALCGDVICENEEKNFSGFIAFDFTGTKQYHHECWCKVMKAELDRDDLF